MHFFFFPLSNYIFAQMHLYVKCVWPSSHHSAHCTCFIFIQTDGRGDRKLFVRSKKALCNQGLCDVLIWQKTVVHLVEPHQVKGRRCSFSYSICLWKHNYANCYQQLVSRALADLLQILMYNLSVEFRFSTSFDFLNNLGGGKKSPQPHM